eukprot:CAMPEP_0171218958 /NCGR_PEP_ID=MMETSP0790-20130122/33469_1 /TAXON_ID=2925 /ORGANISM="Alexandrium catenella, Strain OF101" /LENGTH=261 /DNA_ID=CAMNT_0011684795 /DNA_START=81 /DNA_END=863 /DNA_ORIENTATION=-
MSRTGSVKSFNDVKGWGFIDLEGTDVFVHVKDCTDGRPQAGDTVAFDLDEDKVRAGQHKALNVTGCTGQGKGDGKGKGFGGGAQPQGGGKFQGVVKSFNDTKGWGFIEMQGTDYFLHIKDCQGGRPVVGDVITFDLEEGIREGGQQKACNVSGCSGLPNDGWKGGGKGKSSGYGPMCGGYGGGFGGYGGCYGGGYGGYDDYGCYGGKGYGKDKGKGKAGSALAGAPAWWDHRSDALPGRHTAGRRLRPRAGPAVSRDRAGA